MHFWIQQCSFIVKRGMSSLRKKCPFWHQTVATLLTRLLQFLKFCDSISGETFFKSICVMLCLSLTKSNNFLHFSVICLFYRVASIISVQVAVLQF